MEFKKNLSKYYHKWFRDCHDSAVYCQKSGNTELAETYLNDAREYFRIIIENFDAIEFFSIKDNAYIREESLPVEFRGYK